MLPFLRCDRLNGVLIVFLWYRRKCSATKRAGAAEAQLSGCSGRSTARSSWSLEVLTGSPATDCLGCSFYVYLSNTAAGPHQRPSRRGLAPCCHSLTRPSRSLHIDSLLCILFLYDVAPPSRPPSGSRYVYENSPRRPHYPLAVSSSLLVLSCPRLLAFCLFLSDISPTPSTVTASRLA